MSAALELGHPAETSYLARFQFLEAPFLQSPDARFVYRSESQALVLENVVQGINRGDRLTVVTGDEGSGKTTLCLELLRSFPARTAVSIVLDPGISGSDLLRQLFADFSIVSPQSIEPVGESLGWRDGCPELHALLQTLAEEQRQAVVVIDNAQDLDLNIWEKLFVAWTADHNGARLQIVVVGQPRIEEWLQLVDASGRQAIHRQGLSPLCDREVKEYMERRMWVAQGGVAALSELATDPSPAHLPRRTARRPLFSGTAINTIVNASQGNPRLVNAICDQVLTRASERSSDHVGGRLVKRVAVDLGLPGAGASWRIWASRWTVMGALGLGLAVGLFAAASVKQKESVPTATESAPAPATHSPAYDQNFEAFRKTTLQRATTFSSVPDVRGLLSVRDDVLLWQHQTGYDNHQAMKDLLTELERLTNEARARRLALDHQQFLTDVKKRR